MKKAYIFTSLLMLFFGTGNGAAKEKNNDTLTTKNYEYIINKVKENKKDTFRSKVYAKAWLNKAKKEYNWLQTVKAYRNLMFLEDKKHLLHYSDSLLLEALKTKDNGLIGSAYLTKGIIYYDLKELDKAVDNYIQAHKFIALTKDDYALYKLKYSIAHSKYYLGFYDEAIALFNECLEYFKEENDRAYLNTLHSIGLCYTKIKAYELSSKFNKMGVLMSEEIENDEMIVYFYHSEGINQFFKKEYHKAIASLTGCLPELNTKKDQANINVANFYIAKSYWELNLEDKALEYLLKVDKGIEEQKYLRPDLRENFELLIQYYKKNNDTDAQLLYINKLLKADSTITKNFKYLSGKIFKEFDTSELMEAKNQIEKSKKIQQIGFSSIIIALLILVLILLYKHLQNKKKYKIKFEELMKKDSTNVNPLKTNDETEDELNLKPELIQKILTNLEKFENSKKILTKDLTISKLANILHTNENYATKIIKKYRHKKSIDYISGLKIDYAIHLLKTEKIYRKYTNAYLADELGFTSVHNFTSAFKKTTGITVTYFIENLNKQEAEN